MSQSTRPVYEALERWESKGLVSEELSATLRREVAEASDAGAARLGQFVIAATGAAVLLIAAGVFLSWSWPRMSDEMRTGVLLLLGVGVHLGGARLEAARRWVPAAYFMQTAGLAVILTALVYSGEVWRGSSAGSTLVGVGALVVPLVFAPRAFRRNAFMPAVHICFSLGFLAVFLDQATPLSGDAIVWVLDAVLLAATVVIVRFLQRDPSGERHPWALNGFVASLYAACVLVVLTGQVPLGMQSEVAYPLDVWLFLVAGLTLWGIHRAPPGLRRDWFEDQLALCMLAWIPLGLFTALEAMNGSWDLALLLVGGVAVAGFWHGLKFRIRRLLGVSALAFIVAIWLWAIDRAGALGAVFALGVTAAILFWVSGKAGGAGQNHEGRASPSGEAAPGRRD
jgi:hypothetical protein